MVRRGALTAKTERCPICDVSVRAENLLRHLEDIHPRHPSASAIRERIRREPGHAPARRPSAPFRVRKAHVVVVAAILLIGAGAYVAAPYLRPNRNFSVDSCIDNLGIAYHIHPQLSMFIQGSRYAIANGIGIQPGCTRPLHTHPDYNPATEPAKIHVESPIAREFTLSDFFHVWGQTLTPTQVLGYANDGTNVVRMMVNGVQSTAFGALVLVDAQQIEISYGP